MLRVDPQTHLLPHSSISKGARAGCDGLRFAPVFCLPGANKRTRPFASLAQYTGLKGVSVMREGSPWKARRREARAPRTCNKEPDGACLLAGTPIGNALVNFRKTIYPEDFNDLFIKTLNEVYKKRKSRPLPRDFLTN